MTSPRVGGSTAEVFKGGQRAPLVSGGGDTHTAMTSAAARGVSVGVLAVRVVLLLLLAASGVQSRATSSRALPLHMLSVAAALREVEADIANEARQISSDVGTASSDVSASSSDTVPFWPDEEDTAEADDTPLERPPQPALSVPLNSAEFSEYSGRTSRPRRSKKGRRRGGLRLDREEYQFWLRSGECRKTTEGEEQFFCPTPDSRGNWRCTTANTLCDGKNDCPGGEDEHGTACLFYKAISDQLSSVANHVLKLKEHHRNH